MKVRENITLYAGAEAEKAVVGKHESEKTEYVDKKTQEHDSGQRKNIYVGNGVRNSTLQDRISAKKEKAQKQAMRLVRDAFSGDRAVDEDIENRKQKIDELKGERKILQEEAAGIAERRVSLEKAYEAGEVSKSDYFAEAVDFSREEQEYRAKLSDNENEVLEENAVIRGTKLERLKHNPMGEARKQADAILEAAGEETVSMALEDAKEKIDEASEKREEQAETIAQKREEQEKIREEQAETIAQKRQVQEKISEKQEDGKQQAEEFFESMSLAELVSADKAQNDVKQEVQSILNKMKLLAEDIKGAAVDETL